MKAVTALCSMLVFLMTLAPSAFGAAPEWILLDENDESSFFYDKAGATKQGEGVVRVKTRVIYTQQGKADALETLSKNKSLANLYESRYQYDLKCGDKESRLLEVAHLDKDGKSLRTTELGSVTEWEMIPPAVRIMLVLEEVCASGATPAAKPDR